MESLSLLLVCHLGSYLSQLVLSSSDGTVFFGRDCLLWVVLSSSDGVVPS